MDEKLFDGCVKIILEKYVDPVLKGISRKAREEWEHFKVDFDIAFIQYLKNSYSKYSKIKTILYKTEPQFIYDFFEVPFLKRGKNNKRIKAESINDILNISNFIIIQGMGGIGKSTLMKHLFIDEIVTKEYIPVYIELKDINDLESTYTIPDLIFEKMNNLGNDFSKNCLDYALGNGCFVFLLDGYDEIITEKRNKFFKLLDAFCDKYPNNHFIISSRPYSEFIELQRFTVLTTCPFSKDQAISLVRKIKYDEEIKNRFISALEQKLYKDHESFASNPLLLSIMLLTFENYAEIPSKLHLFYANAFETLFEKHDATKAGYRREIRSGLPFDSFRKIFSYFCFISYVQAKIEFSRDDLFDIFNKIKINGITYNTEDYIYDLVNSLCVLYRDGINFRFTHRSFQEYFTAFFLKELSDDNMSRVALSIIRKDPYRASHDSVFRMLSDMTEDRFETNILLPLLTDLEGSIEGNKYDYYLEKIVSKIEFTTRLTQNKLELALFFTAENNLEQFVYRFSNPYRRKNKMVEERQMQAEAKILAYLKNGQEDIDEEGLFADCDSIINTSKLYDMVKETWIGDSISALSTLKNAIEEKQKNMEIDLTGFLQ